MRRARAEGHLGSLIGAKAMEFCTFYEFLIGYSKMTARDPVFVPATENSPNNVASY